MFRDATTAELQASLYQSEDVVQNEPPLYASDREFMVFFDDESSVMLELKDDEKRLTIFNVHVNGDFSKTCMFRGEKEGTFVHIFKELDSMRVAPGSDSFCISAHAPTYKKKPKKSHPPSKLKNRQF